MNRRSRRMNSVARKAVERQKRVGNQRRSPVRANLLAQERQNWNGLPLMFG